MLSVLILSKTQTKLFKEKDLLQDELTETIELIDTEDDTAAADEAPAVEETESEDAPMEETESEEPAVTETKEDFLEEKEVNTKAHAQKLFKSVITAIILAIISTVLPAYAFVFTLFGSSEISGAISVLSLGLAIGALMMLKKKKFAPNTYFNTLATAAKAFSIVGIVLSALVLVYGIVQLISILLSVSAVVLIYGFAIALGLIASV